MNLNRFFNLILVTRAPPPFRKELKEFKEFKECKEFKEFNSEADLHSYEFNSPPN